MGKLSRAKREAREALARDETSSGATPATPIVSTGEDRTVTRRRVVAVTTLSIHRAEVGISSENRARENYFESRRGSRPQYPEYSRRGESRYPPQEGQRGGSINITHIVRRANEELVHIDTSMFTLGEEVIDPYPRNTW